LRGWRGIAGISIPSQTNNQQPHISLFTARHILATDRTLYSYCMMGLTVGRRTPSVWVIAWYCEVHSKTLPLLMLECFSCPSSVAVTGAAWGVGDPLSPELLPESFVESYAVSGPGAPLCLSE
jgi:hypothetical protein